jgi:hypothetical protein
MTRWGLALVVVVGAAPGRTAADRDADWIARQIAQIKPTGPAEVSRIAWATSLNEARRISRNEGRPIFLFSFDGNLATGRC